MAKPYSSKLKKKKIQDKLFKASGEFSVLNYAHLSKHFYK